MKLLLTLAFASVFVFACNSKSTSIQSSENEKIVIQYYEYFNKHDWENMSMMYTDTSEFKDPSLGQGVVKQTRNQIVKKYTELAELFPDVKDKIVQIYPSGDKHIIVEFISSGTAPDGLKFELPICTIFTIEKGFITKDFTYYDNF